MDEKNIKGAQPTLIESPDYRTSCLSTLKSLFSMGTHETLPNEDEIKPIKLFSTFNSSDRLLRLRKLMRLNNLTCYIIPSEDEHQSEYTAEKDQRRSFISGFTGSSGIAIVTLNSAALSTDSRYFLQAEDQLDGNWILLKQGVSGYPDWVSWMIGECVYEMDQLKESGNIGIDPRLVTWKLGKDLIVKCHENNLSLVNDLGYNLVDSIRGKCKTKVDPVFKFDLKYSGLHANQKFQQVRSIMKSDNCFVYVSNMLDSLAWLLNLRGNDILFNPVFFSYIVIYMDRIILYIDKKKISKEVETYLVDELSITIRSYDRIWDDLPAIECEDEKIGKICLDLNSSYSIYINIPSIYDIKFRSILTELKGIKNEIEIANLRESQIIDSLAIIRFFGWFYNNFNKFELNELDVVDKLFEFRNQSKKFKGLSFETIAASGPNGAIVHYEPTNDNYSSIKKNNMLLIDSGGQYFEGTTDITRTIYVFKDKLPTEEQRRLYTLVLKGHLNIAMLKFPKGTSSYYIDSLARLPLRKIGLDYGHGTGHGIDNYICVHSGPCGLSPSQTSYNYKPLEAGNFISNEPGYYKDGEFGIRIESDVLVTESTYGKDVLEFDYLTKVPFCVDLIDKAYLDKEQIVWINNYHASIYETMEPYLADDENGRCWLKKATMPL